MKLKSQIEINKMPIMAIFFFLFENIHSHTHTHKHRHHSSPLIKKVFSNATECKLSKIGKRSSELNFALVELRMSVAILFI